MIYLDANVFIYAATDEGPTGKAAVNALRKAIDQGACTASLTVDEVLWALSKKFSREVAVERVRKLLELDLQVLSVGKKEVQDALPHVVAGLDPRDAIHAAVALRQGCTRIVSTDAAFRQVKGLRHQGY